MSETERCSDCPPVGYSTDRTRCVSCDRSAHEQLSRAFGEAEADKIIPTKNTGKQTMPEGKSEIPDDIRKIAAHALNVAEDMSGSLFCERVEVIAKAILAERERCAKIAEGDAVGFDFQSALADGDDLNVGANSARLGIAQEILPGYALPLHRGEPSA